jgi:hypothetical protein
LAVLPGRSFRVVVKNIRALSRERPARLLIGSGRRPEGAFQSVDEAITHGAASSSLSRRPVRTATRFSRIVDEAHSKSPRGFGLHRVGRDNRLRDEYGGRRGGQRQSVIYEGGHLQSGVNTPVFAWVLRLACPMDRGHIP